MVRILFGITIAAIALTSPGSVLANEMSGLVDHRPRNQSLVPAGIEQAVGFYSNGSLLNASALPMEDVGIVKLLQNRNRHWGTQDLVQILTEVAADILHQYPWGERLQIGDMSDQDGGQLSRHASHQNGLDVDVVYYRNDRREQDPIEDRGLIENFVQKGKVTPNFDTVRNWAFIKSVVSTGRVKRIFVDEVIKQKFCQYTKDLGEFEQSTEYLRRLRPWPHHDDHLHLRITCPESSPNCKEQQDPAHGSGCP